MKQVLFILITIIILSNCFTSISLYSQDTIRYDKLQSIGRKTKVLISSIELYSDSLFTWRSEHDLSWDEYGLYNIKEDTLILDFYYHDLDNINIDSLDWTFVKREKEIKEIRKYLMVDNKMFRIKKNGKLEKWTNGRTLFTDKWRWLTLGYRKTYYVF